MRRLAIAVLLVAAVSAADEVDEEGCADHPKLKRLAGFRLSSCTVNEASSYDFTVAAEKTEPKEGRFWDLGYALKSSAKQPTVSSVVKGLEERVRKLGGKRVFQASEGDGATVSFWTPLGATQRWIQLEVADKGESFSLKIVEVAAPEQKVERTTAELKSALSGEEPVALYGIVFEPEKDRLKPESQPLLAQLVALLRENPGVSIAIEGHVHGGGGPTLNQFLAQRRADAVKKHLVGQGIAAERVETKGVGEGGAVQSRGADDGAVQRWWLELRRL